MTENLPWLSHDRTTQTLELRLYIQPGAKQSCVVGMHGEALKIRLAARAIDGQANRELLRFLAKQLSVSTQQITILRGTKARRKTVQVRHYSGEITKFWARYCSPNE